MRAPETIIHFEEQPLADTSQDPRKAAYEAGLLVGREAGYKQGFQDGFLASLKNRNEAAEVVAKESQPANVELAPNGRPLVGPPCVKCGRCFAGALTQCPRCNAPSTVPAQPQQG
jgi:hypothetical protein